MAGNLCYLFGLNWHITEEYRDIADKEGLRRKLRQAARHPMLGRIVGNAAELRSQIAVAEQRTQTLERQLNGFVCCLNMSGSRPKQILSRCS